MSIYKTDVIAIRKKMVEKRINTIVDLSKESGVNRNTLAKVINEEAQPTSETMEKLVSCLEITPEEAGVIFFGQTLLQA